MSAKGVLINVAQHNHQSKYHNQDAFGNCAKYACKVNGNPNELVGYRFFGVPYNLPLEEQIEDVYQIQKLHDIESRGGRRAAHMVDSIQESEFGEYGNNPELVMRAFEAMGRCIYDEGYQVLVATHYNPRNDGQGGAFMHAHLVINNINYRNGKKFHKTKAEICELEQKFNEIQGNYQQMSPVRFENADYFRQTNPQYQTLYMQTAKEQAADTARSQQNH